MTCHAETRTWTDVNSRRIEAELVSYDAENEMIRIRKSDGKTHSISVEKLSEADREWLKEQDAEGGDEGTADEPGNGSAKAGSTVEMLSDGSPQMTYHVYYPSSYKDGSQPPLLFLFNSGGDSKPLLNHVRKGCDSLGWIAIGCDWKKGQGMHDETFPSTLKHIEKNISYDQNAMYLVNRVRCRFSTFSQVSQAPSCVWCLSE
ncbi:MAG: hypothetical protein IZT59_02835, partial [Verrucomicrobia bacterium]|nr:hypothetical protein [Verrucomicrobiota bacterium]